MNAVNNINTSADAYFAAMLIVISPAKSLNFTAPDQVLPLTTPALKPQIAELATRHRMLSIGDGELAETAVCVVPLPEIFSHYLQRGRVEGVALGHGLGAGVVLHGFSPCRSLRTDDAAARRGQGAELGRSTQRLVLVEQLQVLSKFGPVLGDFGQVFVVGIAQVRAVLDGMQMPDHTPSARQTFVGVFQGRDESVPGNGGSVTRDALDGLPAFGQQGVYCRGDMFTADGIETRQS